jgi:hypothetical protein
MAAKIGQKSRRKKIGKNSKWSHITSALISFSKENRR